MVTISAKWFVSKASKRILVACVPSIPQWGQRRFWPYGLLCPEAWERNCPWASLGSWREKVPLSWKPFCMGGAVGWEGLEEGPPVLRQRRAWVYARKGGFLRTPEQAWGFTDSCPAWEGGSGLRQEPRVQSPRNTQLSPLPFLPTEARIVWKARREEVSPNVCFRGRLCLAWFPLHSCFWAHYTVCAVAFTASQKFTSLQKRQESGVGNRDCS